MSNKYPLKYRTFEQLLDEVKLDLPALNDTDSIRPEHLIKVATRINYELGFRINKDKGVMLEVDGGKARLPDNFHVFKYGYVCSNMTVCEALPQGTTIEEVLGVPEYKPWREIDPCCEPDPCNLDKGCDTNCPPICITECGDCYHLVHKVNTQIRQYSYVEYFSLEKSKFVDCECPNVFQKSMNKAHIEDGWIHFNFDSGNVYIHYMSTMENEDGELIVPDHPYINEYFEYGLKKRIFEKLVLGNENYVNQLNLIKSEYRAARANAISFTNLPDFAELKKLKQIKRKAFIGKFVNRYM